MPREEWVDFYECLDAWWADCPVFASMPIEDREMWHAFAFAAEQHEMSHLIQANRGKHREAFRRVVR